MNAGMLNNYFMVHFAVTKSIFSVSLLIMAYLLLCTRILIKLSATS
jgi:hypothetical protein